MDAPSSPLIDVRDLSITFRSGSDPVKAVTNLSFYINRGEILALVGESGSGKSVTALSLLGLLPAQTDIAGSVSLAAAPGHPALSVLDADEATLRTIRGDRIAMIFQEPMTALNPLHTIGRQLAEPLKRHRGLSGKALWSRIHELLDMVGLDKLHDRLDAFPHQLSGGERQRVMIAMAMGCDPELLIADEPTTAVDVTVQLQILTLLKKLQRDHGLSLLLITHDLTIVRRMADRVAILRHGQLVETGNTADIFRNPQAEYSRQLIVSEPSGVAVPWQPSQTPLLSTEQLTVRFPAKKNLLGSVTTWFDAVHSVDLTLDPGQTLGIVGESGSGKTTLALALLRLVKSDGPIVFQGNRIDGLTAAQMRPLRQQMQVVFQDPFGSLNPRFSILQILEEGLRLHRRDLSAIERRRICEEMLVELQLQPAMLDRYPHEFSGGQRQRIALARAMVLRPALVVLDEPTSALDLTVQSQVLMLLKQLQEKFGTAFLFISHDLRVVRAISHHVLVMRRGVVIEHGPADTVFTAPGDSYTRDLVAASLGQLPPL